MLEDVDALMQETDWYKYDKSLLEGFASVEASDFLEQFKYQNKIISERIKLIVDQSFTSDERSMPVHLFNEQLDEVHNKDLERAVH